MPEPGGTQPAGKGVAALVFYLLDLESEIFLGYIAYPDRDAGGQNIRWCGVNVQLLHEEFEEHVIQQKTEHDHQQIPEELHPATEIGFGEHDMSHGQEPDRECEHEREQERRDMGRNGQEPEVKILLMEDEMQAESEQE
jgi:hypothetical protein